MSKKISAILTLVLVMCFTTLCSAQTYRGLICYDGDNIHDNGINQMAYNGFAKATTNNRKNIFFTESFLNKKGAKLAEKDVAKVLEDDLDFVIGIGKTYTPLFQKLAKKHQGTKFVVINDKAEKLPSNMETVSFDEVQAGYLAGVAAAATTDSANIGFIAGNKDYKVNNDYFFGYKAGALSVNPQIKIKAEYADSVEKVERRALNMYDGKIDVIFHNTGKNGAGLFAAASKTKKWAIGCESDESLYAKEKEKPYILTSAVIHVDTAVSGVVDDILAKRFEGGVVVKDYRTDSVSFATNEWNKNSLKKAAPALADAEAKLYLDAEELEVKK